MNERNWGGFREGSGRKATGRKTVSVTLTLTTDEAKTLKERAKYDGLSISRFVAKWLTLNLPKTNKGDN